MMDQIHEFQERFERRIDAIPHPENKVLKGVRNVAVSILKPQNKVLRWTRNAVLIVLLAPGSFVAGTALVSLSAVDGDDITGSDGGVSQDKDRSVNSGDKEFLDQEVMERVNDYLAMAAHNNLHSETGIIFSYKGVMFNLQILPLNERQVKFTVSANEDGKAYSHEGVWPE